MASTGSQSGRHCLQEFTPERLFERVNEMVMFTRINQSYRLLKEYMNSRQHWSANHAGVLGAKPVAYFSAEFGIHESLPIYSVGLGVLSGDHVKSASSLGLPNGGDRPVLFARAISTNTSIRARLSE